MPENRPVRPQSTRLVESADELPSVNELQAEISTLESMLRKPRPETSYSEDQECQRIVAMVEQLGATPVAAEDGTSSGEASMHERLGQYELLVKLGEGGMGAVYKARHTKLNKLVALKVLPADRLDDEQAVTRFEREMRAVGQLDHPNLVAAHDAGEIDGCHYLVMELVDGVDLSALVRSCGALPPAEACEVICRAAEGLQHAHASGMVHRDIKPGNLMLTFDGQVKVLDMGLALLDELKNPGKGELTTTGQMMGTLDYMAPEQGTDSHLVDIRADVYSLGATLFRLLTGEVPFFGPKYDAPVSKMMALALEIPRTVSEVRDDVPPELSEIVARMLAKAPDERPATPQEVIDLLEPFARDGQLKEVARVAREKVETETDAPSNDTFAHLRSSFTDTQPTIERAPQIAAARGHVPPRNNRRWWIAAAAAAAGIVLLAVLFTLRTDRGTIIVEVPAGEEKNIQLAVMENGQTVNILDADNGWTIRVAEGEYQIDVKKGGDRFAIDNNELTVSRDGTERVKVAFKPTQIALPDQESTPDNGSIVAHVLEFDASKGSYVEIPSLRFDGTKPITVEAWLKAPTGGGCVVGNSQRAGCSLYANGIFDVRQGQGGKTFSFSTTDWVPSNHWYHLAATFNGESIQVFADGKPLTGGIGTRGGYSAAPFSFKIGARPNGHGGKPEAFFSGMIDEIRISKTVRYASAFSPSRSFEPDEQTLALYHFNEGEGEQLRDSSGNNHHGKIVGAKWVASSGPATADGLISNLPVGEVEAKAPANITQTTVIKLTELKPLVANASRNGFRSVSNDVSSGGPVLRPDVKYAEEYLFVMTPSRIRYAVPKGMKSFTTVGCAFCPWAAGFKVMTGNTTLYESKGSWETVRLDLPPETETIDLIGVRTNPRDPGQLYWVAPRFHPVPAAEVENLFAKTGSHVSVTDLKPVLIRPKGYEPLVNRTSGGFAPPVENDGFGRCRDYLLAHAPSHLEYEIPAGATAFSAVGYSRSKGACFQVYADDVLVYSSPNAGVVPLKAPLLAGAGKLTLKVGGSEFRSDSHWCYPRFYIGEPQASSSSFPVAGTVEEKQEWLIAELRQLNPGFNKIAGIQFTDAKLTGVDLGGSGVSCIDALRALPNLEALNLRSCPVSDLSSLAGKKLVRLDASETRITDLTLLRLMPLAYLSCENTPIKDVMPLAGMPLKELHIRATRVVDISPLRSLPLEHLHCNFNRQRDAPFLSQIKTLETLNDKPAAEALQPPLELEKQPVVQVVPLYPWNGKPPALSKNVIRLADIEPLYAVSQDRAFRRATDGNGPALRPDVKYAEEYLSANTPSRLRYAVPKGMKSFTAVGYASCYWAKPFKVMAGSTTLYESKGSWETVRLDLPPDTETIDLVAGARSDSHDPGYLSWVVPRFHPVPATEVDDLFIPTGKHIRITELKPVLIEPENHELLVNQPPPSRVPPVINDHFEPCGDYLFAHATSRIEYEVPAGATAFSAIGYCRGKNVCYKVYADETLLFESPAGGVVPVRISLPKTTSSIILIIAGSDFRTDSYWCYPRFHIGEAEVSAPKVAPGAGPVVKKAEPAKITTSLREWTDSSGKHKVQAELLAVENDIVRLRKAEDGKEVDFPLSKLSEADQAFVSQWTERTQASE